MNVTALRPPAFGAARLSEIQAAFQNRGDRPVRLRDVASGETFETRFYVEFHSRPPQLKFDRTGATDLFEDSRALHAIADSRGAYPGEFLPGESHEQNSGDFVFPGLDLLG